MRSLQQTVSDATYLDFFGLARPPFARLSDPSQIFYTEQYSLLMEHLAEATTNADSLVVLCGADGSGKSTLLNSHMSSIGEQVSYVVVDDTCEDEVQFYTTFLAQIGFDEISGTLQELRNITKEFLVCRGIAGDHILILFDNAHLTDPRILKQLRWLCDIKIKDRKVLSVVLAGNAGLVRVVDAPAMRSIKFGSHVAFSIRAYTEEETANYVWHRLRLAGGDAGVKLSQETYARIHRYSGGIPHLINDLCHATLAEAHDRGTRAIDEKIVRIVADKQQLLPHVVPLHGRGRRRTDPDFRHLQAVPDAEDSASTDGARTNDPAGATAQPPPDLDPENLLEQIARLSAQVDDLRSDKMRAIQDIEARNEDITELREELGSQSRNMEGLSQRLVADLENEMRARQAAENELAAASESVADQKQLTEELQTTISNLEIHLEESQKKREEAELQISRLRNPKELQKIRKKSDRRAADLRKQTRARKTAEKELAEAMAKVDELSQLMQEQQATIGDLEIRFEKSQSACELAQLRIVELKSPKEVEAIERASENLAAELERERSARESLDKELAEATAAAGGLSQLKQEHQAALDSLQADIDDALEVADERAGRIEALEKQTSKLEAGIEAKTDEFDLLRKELDDERGARETADNERAKMTAFVDELSQLKHGLLATVDSLQADVAASNKVADERAARIEALEKQTSKLEAGVEAKTDELDSLRKELGDERHARETAENELAKTTAFVDDLSQLKHDLLATVDSLQADVYAGNKVADERAAEIEDLHTTIAGLHAEIKITTAELVAQAAARDEPVELSDVAKRFEKSIRGVPAYKSLRKYDPVFYDGLVSKYEKLVERGLTDKQVNDALRGEQAELMERLLPRASNVALIAYARLIVDQLDEYQLDGIEPCLKLLVPKSSPDDDAEPAYSERCKDRELDLLDKTLKSYEANRPLPAEEDVWPDLERIFEELFNAFGADNVAAMQNSYDPSIDRVLVCNVTRALYSGILNMPKGKIANALRWLLST